MRESVKEGHEFASKHKILFIIREFLIMKYMPRLRIGAQIDWR